MTSASLIDELTLNVLWHQELVTTSPRFTRRRVAPAVETSDCPQAVPASRPDIDKPIDAMDDLDHSINERAGAGQAAQIRSTARPPDSGDTPRTNTPGM